MKKYIFVLLILAFSFSQNGCMMLMMPGMMGKMSHEKHDGDDFLKHKTHIENKISDVLTEQVERWNEGSLEGYMNTYEKSDSILFASGGDITFGWNTLFERFKKRYTSVSEMGNLTFTDLKVEAFSSTSAMAFGRWKIAREPAPIGGLFTLIVKKIKGEWKVVHDHTSMQQ